MAMVEVPEVPQADPCDRDIYPWEFTFLHRDPSGGLPDFNGFHSRQWHMCSNDHNVNFSYVWRLLAANGRDDTRRLPPFPVVFQRSGFSSTKYVLDGYLRLVPAWWR